MKTYLRLGMFCALAWTLLTTEVLSQVTTLKKAEVLSVVSYGTMEDDGLGVYLLENGKKALGFRACPQYTLASGCDSCRVTIQQWDVNYSHMQSEYCRMDTPTIWQYRKSNGEFIGVGGSQDFIVMRFAADGSLLSKRRYGGSFSETIKWSCPTTDGGYMLVGVSLSADGDVGVHYGNPPPVNSWDDWWIVKIDSMGDKQWSRVFGGSNPDLPEYCLPTEDGGAFVLGASLSEDYDMLGVRPSGAYNKPALFIRLDVAGNIVWKKGYGNYNGAGANHAVSDGRGGLYVVGDISVDNGNPNNDSKSHQWGDVDVWVWHIDGMGNLLWETRLGGPGWDQGKKIDLGADGHLWVVGESTLKGGLVDTCCLGHLNTTVVYHLDTLGHYLQSRALASKYGQKYRNILAAADGTALVTGTYTGTGNLGTENQILLLLKEIH